MGAVSRELWLVTGLSGAGKSLALKCLEDLGFWCVDNLPVPLVKTYLELEASREHAADSLNALGLRGIEQLKEVEGALRELPDRPFRCRLLFLECDEDVLLKRYSESRRLHPLVDSGLGLLQALREERVALRALKERADYVVDTTALSPHTLMTRLESLLAEVSGKRAPLLLHIQSFGFKHGVPADAEWLWDVRFLPNPYYLPELRPHSGLELEVEDAVFAEANKTATVESLFECLERVLPTYLEEGRRQVTLAIGCTGGQHRSVATAERLGKRLAQKGYSVSVFHRDAQLSDSREPRRSRFFEPEIEPSEAVL